MGALLVGLELRQALLMIRGEERAVSTLIRIALETTFHPTEGRRRSHCFYGKSPTTNRKLGEDEKRLHEKAGASFGSVNEVHIWIKAELTSKLVQFPEVPTRCPNCRITLGKREQKLC